MPDEMLFDHAMQRASTIFGHAQRATIVAACIQAAAIGADRVNVSTDARALFIEVVKAFTPDT